MDGQILKSRIFLKNSFFASIFIHLIVLNAFIFTFPVQSESFKPQFLFLGSILKQQDISEVMSHKGFPHLNTPSLTDGEALPSLEKPISKFNTRKPKTPVSSKKSEIKTTFETSQKILNNKDSVNSQSFVEPLPPYKPLKLIPNDQN